MCQALIDLMEDSKKEGIEQGIQQGIQQGRTEERIKIAKAVIHNMRQLNVPQIELERMLVTMECTKEEIEQLL